MKKIFSLVLVVSLIVSFSIDAFAVNRWVQNNGYWYVYDDNNQPLKNMLIDVTNNVYYLDEEGKMVVGWWRHPTTNKAYFFDNNKSRNYGGMVFGLHMVDGYFRYFGDDGSVQTSDGEGQYKKVFQEFWADENGLLYFNNVLLRDTTTNKSEYYSNPEYYTNDQLNNYYLANYDVAVVDGSKFFAQVGNANSNVDNNRVTTGRESDGGLSGKQAPTGGTNYTIDAEGRIISQDKETDISGAEKYGPMVGLPNS